MATMCAWGRREAGPALVLVGVLLGVWWVWWGYMGCRRQGGRCGRCRAVAQGEEAGRGRSSWGCILQQAVHEHNSKGMGVSTLLQ